jgi:hypothetical protein
VHTFGGAWRAQNKILGILIHGSSHFAAASPCVAMAIHNAKNGLIKVFRRMSADLSMDRMTATDLRWCVSEKIQHPPPNVRAIFGELQFLQSHPTSLTQPNLRCGLLNAPKSYRRSIEWTVIGILGDSKLCG